MKGWGGSCIGVDGWRSGLAPRQRQVGSQWVPPPSVPAPGGSAGTIVRSSSWSCCPFPLSSATRTRLVAVWDLGRVRLEIADRSGLTRGGVEAAAGWEWDRLGVAM